MFTYFALEADPWLFLRLFVMVADPFILLDKSSLWTYIDILRYWTINDVTPNRMLSAILEKTIVSLGLHYILITQNN